MWKQDLIDPVPAFFYTLSRVPLLQFSFLGTGDSLLKLRFSELTKPLLTTVSAECDFILENDVAAKAVMVWLGMNPI